MRERPNQKSPRIEPEAVVRAGLEILDEEGLDNITLRKIASRLGVQAPALYWHFKDKSDIIDDMAQAILKEGGIEDLVVPSDKGAWADWLTCTAHTLHKAMLSHREGGRIVAGATLRSKAMLHLKVTSTQVLHDAGFDLLRASLASETVSDYVWGYVIEEQAGGAPELESGLIPDGRSIPRSKAIPEWKMLEDVWEERKQLTGDELFDWGLQIIISGLKVSLNESKECPRQ